MMRPINVAEVTQAIVDMLKANADLQDTLIERAEEVNKEPRVGGWVGVYRAGIKYQTKALGGNVPRQQAISLIVLVQESDALSGASCEDALEALIQKVLSVILSDESLGGKVDILDPNDFEIRYGDYRKIADTFMQTATIYLTGLLRVGVQ
jgi:hypothetical protein